MSETSNTCPLSGLCESKTRCLRRSRCISTTTSAPCEGSVFWNSLIPSTPQKDFADVRYRLTPERLCGDGR